ncbi:twin-arginine translocase TatA/TatE family subunit [Candidatus Geothermarchaeota archaeon]|nr:MAG: twin-arginine translocase TatA/TatE family subunit [Candidatus Geothermarchaeota archaeon]RLG62558.1 MAG: twin-arginine translocase TatA/TatE family subunit [Candidatus Geothermarchaeota archaeon]HEW93852.1 twin-arginine translocase TatA/TatE family subunit [Thermoprotei archaeon]
MDITSLILYTLGPTEILIIIFVIVLLIWGPSQLPKLAKALGQAKREFQKAQEEEEEEKPKKKRRKKKTTKTSEE